MTKKELRVEKLNRHYLSLEELSLITNGKVKDGKKLSNKLFKLEKKAYKAALNWCNGDIDTDVYNIISDEVEKEVLTLLPDLKGFFTNSDARGHSLKINDKVFKELYKSTGLSQDWGGYGILSPEID